MIAVVTKRQKSAARARAVTAIVVMALAWGSSPAGAAVADDSRSVPAATEVTAAKKAPSAKAQRKQLLRVHRIAKKSSNYTSWRRITAKKNPRVVFYGVGKPTKKVRQAIRVARKKTGLKILWNSKARHTRSELRAAGKIVRRDKQVAFTDIFLPRGCLDIIFWDGDLSSLSPSELKEHYGLDVCVRAVMLAEPT